MKQNIISFLSTIKEDIYSICEFLYDNPEKPFNENKSSKYLIDILKKYNFNVIDNFLDIPTAFYGQYGEGHPKICIICKYSADENDGHIYGNNANASISIASAIASRLAVDKLSGSIVIVGCPGLYSNGSEIKMTYENVFDDMDVILAPHVDICSSESGTSMASIPLKIEYILDTPYNNSLDYSIFNLNGINEIVKSSCGNCYIDNLSIDINNKIHGKKIKEMFKFNIKSPNMKFAEEIEYKIKNYIKNLETLLKIKYESALYELPSKELISNKILSRIFSNNLKECGIINVCEPKTVDYSLGIGTVSHTTPTIYPSIGITENQDINCPSLEFKELTLSPLCKERIIKTAEALAITAVDFIERKDLLQEIAVELNKNISANN
ncbi:MAG: hypothetical protein KID00_06225 [Clostridium argentinense]|uniref:Peptidase M20 domain-containing protein 2 n=1 Tax=Clostridium faecium TaxID=2762223 RepID=A0ABR8YWE1_9CLOT|nr:MULTISPECIES: hypothetical protein [Clostridium]MBD8048447.1 hypothetical protein [Clostridium faecium]MBS5823445.1 hypothetical protein [Clostridium argentinense]MDU1348570.1 hypothetical protein [Clostridium argentinense]